MYIILVVQSTQFGVTPHVTLNRRVHSFMLMAAAGKLLPREGVCECCRKPVPGAAHVSVKYNQDTGRARFGNLKQCRSVWLCANCSWIISERRRRDLAAALDAAGCFLLLVTYTVQHHSFMLLPEMLSALLDSFRAARRGEPFRRIQKRYGWLHDIRALEVTFGLNGWHPHIHQIILMLAELSADELEAFADWMRTRWITMLEKRGFSASLEHGLDVRAGQMTVSEYVTKYGYEPRWSASHELARTNAKVARTETSRTPFALLEDYALNDDIEAGRRFQEFAAAFKGRRKLQPSDGFWKELLPDGAATDEEIVDAEEVSPAFELLALLTLEHWRVIVRRGLRGELLQAVEEGQGNVDNLTYFLRSQGL